MRLKVAFVGLLVVKLNAPVEATPPSGRIGGALGLVDALYIPAMPSETTLISTKSIFRKQGIRAYFNDELYLSLCSGFRYPIHETHLGYFLSADHEFDATALQPHQIYVPTTSRAAAARMTMVDDATMVDIDTRHARLCHFSFERMRASQHCTTGMQLSDIVRPKMQPDACERGGGARAAAPPTVRQQKFTRFGQRINCDQIAMPKSTPFGFENMCTFHDMATKTLAVYFTRGHTNAEMRQCMLQFEADYKHDLKHNNGHAELWYCDNHGEYSSKEMDKFLAEHGSRQQFIVPWNPQQNPAERQHQIVLRPLRIMCAASNCSVRVWPFIASQIALVHNSLANRSATAMTPGRSSYEMRTGRIPDLSIFRVMCCQMHAVVRAERDIQARGKLAPVKTACVHLGWDSKRCGYFGYAYESDMLRLSTWRRQECTFNEMEMPRVGFIVGKYVNPDGKEILLPSEGQQPGTGKNWRQG